MNEVKTLTIGEMIRMTRKSVGIKQVELANKLNVTQATVSQYERESERSPKHPTLKKIAKALNVSVFDLYPPEDVNSTIEHKAMCNGCQSREIGKLFYDTHEGRLNISFEDGTYSGGLRCGDGLEFRTVDFSKSRLGDEVWVHTRIEYDHKEKEWYLDGISGEIPIDNVVRRLSK